MVNWNEDVEALGLYALDKYSEFKDILELGVRIAWLSSDQVRKKAGKTVYAECIKVKPEYEWCCNYDFMIVFYERNVAELTKKQLRILMRHELKHIGINWDGDEPKMVIVPHDVEDFSDIIRRYGMKWAR